MIFNIKYSISVKIRNFKTGWIFLIVIPLGFSASAQLNSGRLQQYLSENLDKKELGINYQKETRDFYACINYETAWIQEKNVTNLTSLLSNFSSAANWGLRETDYQYGFISAYKNGTFILQNTEDSLKAEALFTDAAIHFYNDIAYGNAVPALGYTGIKYVARCMNVPAMMAEFISNNNIDSLPAFLSSPIFEIKIIGNKINWMLEAMNKNDFKEI